MNGKQSKKIRREARRVYANAAMEMAKLYENILKPKPKWIPEKIYIWILGFFIIIKKKK